MTPNSLLALLLLLGALGFGLAHRRAFRASMNKNRENRPHSRPVYHGVFTLLLTLVPALLVVALWLGVRGAVLAPATLAALPAADRPAAGLASDIFLTEVVSLAHGTVPVASRPAVARGAHLYTELEARGTNLVGMAALALGSLGLMIGFLSARPAFRARFYVESGTMALLMLASGMAILTTLGIILSLLFETLRFFNHISPWAFFTGLEWNPHAPATGLAEGQESGLFGAVPLFWGTAFVALIAMLVAGPIGLMAAIYLTQYASRRVRSIAKPLLEILAGVPTVVYGFFAALTVAPLIRQMGEALGIPASSESALAAGLVMGVMIIPFMSSLSDDAIAAVPRALKDGSLALGATPSETIRKVLIPAALPGIMGAFLLAVSRAIGETMIVVMAAGLSAHLTANPFESVTTVTVQIVKLLTGDQEFESAATLSAFALGFALFMATLLINILALHLVRKYRESYE